MIVSGYRVHKWKIWNTEFTWGTSGYKAVWESGINSEDGAVSLFRFRSNTSGWWGKLKKKSVRELSLKECLSFFLTLDYMCQYKSLWFLFIKWMSFLDLFWVLSWLDSRCSSVKWLYPFGFIWGNEIFTSEEKSTCYGQHLLKLIWYHLFVVVVFYQSAVALFDMVEYYESACKVNIAFNKNISGRGWQGCARMIRKVCYKKYI